MSDWSSVVFLWICTLTICSHSTMAVPVNYLRLYLDEPQASLVSGLEEDRRLLFSPLNKPRPPPTLIIVENPSNNVEETNLYDSLSDSKVNNIDETSPLFTKRRAPSPFHSSLQQQQEDGPTENARESRAIPTTQKLLRIERNFHGGNHGADKMYQIQNVGDLPMFRFG